MRHGNSCYSGLKESSLMRLG